MAKKTKENNNYQIVALPGDGVGPEVMEQGLKVVRWLSEQYSLSLEVKFCSIGGHSIDHHGVPLTDQVLQQCLEVEAVLLGAVGGPKWNQLDFSIRPERGLLKLRQDMGLFANLRPAFMFPQLISASPLREEIVKGTDLLVLRELISGIYFGRPSEIDEQKKRAVDTMIYREEEILRIARVAFGIATKKGKKLASVDKANVLACSRLWRRVVDSVASQYPQVKVEHLYIDNCAMQLLSRPAQFDVILTGNMFGDILSDQAGMVTGSIGMLPSASLKFDQQGQSINGLYEPVHGSAPDIAGQDLANPLAMILSVAMMLQYSLQQEECSRLVRLAVNRVLDQGFRTADIFDNQDSECRQIGCNQMGDLVVKAMETIANG